MTQSPPQPAPLKAKSKPKSKPDPNPNPDPGGNRKSTADPKTTANAKAKAKGKQKPARKPPQPPERKAVGTGRPAVVAVPVRSEAAARPGTGPGTGPTATPAAAFDALYVSCAGGLIGQVRVLTGNPQLARSAVARAFDLAWQRWPEVARDTDPVGWVRAAAYAYALAPWQRWVPGHRKATDASHVPPLQAALLRLPPEHRRALLLYDGLGLDLPEAAAESESSTPATACRITRAREAMAAELPELAEVAELTGNGAGPGGAGAHPVAARLSALLAEDTAPPAKPAGVRAASERRVRHRTAAAVGLAAAIAVATLATMVISPVHGRPAPPRHVPQAGQSAPSPGAPGVPPEAAAPQAPPGGAPHHAPAAAPRQG